MAWRISGMSMALALALVGCSDDAGGDPTPETTATSMSTSGSTGSPEAVDGDTFAGDGSGSVEEGGGDTTTFGMSDDMPLVVAVPDIKRGDVPDGTRVTLESVVSISGRATLEGLPGFFVEDPEARAYMGLRVRGAEAEAAPEPGTVLELTGSVWRVESGWELSLMDLRDDGDGFELVPHMLDLDMLASPEAEAYDDTLVEVTGADPVEVLGPGREPGVFRLGSKGAGVAELDLRPFDLVESLGLEAGMQLEQLVGVAEISGGTPTLLPRDEADVIIAP